MIDIQSESGSTPSQGHGQGQVTSTAHLSSAELGQWNTSTRLLATLLNDHMVVATPCVRGRSGLILHGIGAFSEPQSPALWVALSEAGQLRLVDHNIKANTAVFPEDFAPPAVTTTFASPDIRSGVDLAPASIFNHLRPVLNAPPVDDDRWDEICCELTNSAENGHYWNEWYRHRKTLSFKSSRLEWEQALYTGHPLHPVRPLNTYRELGYNPRLRTYAIIYVTDLVFPDASGFQDGRLHAQDSSQGHLFNDETFNQLHLRSWG